MFLEYFNSAWHIIQCILTFVEEHTATIGVMSALFGGFFWARRFIRQKRAEAFFGLYAKLMLCINALVTALQEDEQLETNNPKKGNIFCLLYSEDCLRETCPQYFKPSNKIDLYKKYAKELGVLLQNTEQNVYPKGSKRSEWYEQLFIIYSFCDFLCDEQNWNTTNEPKLNNEYKHTKRCNEFLAAVEYVKKAIEKAKY